MPNSNNNNNSNTTTNNGNLNSSNNNNFSKSKSFNNYMNDGNNTNARQGGDGNANIASRRPINPTSIPMQTHISKLNTTKILPLTIHKDANGYGMKVQYYIITSHTSPFIYS